MARAWELEWWQSSIPIHAGMKQFARDLNVLYRDCKALHELDFSRRGFPGSTVTTPTSPS